MFKFRVIVKSSYLAHISGNYNCYLSGSKVSLSFYTVQCQDYWHNPTMNKINMWSYFPHLKGRLYNYAEVHFKGSVSTCLWQNSLNLHIHDNKNSKADWNN